ncbi:MAG: polysaccharide pyruvyl transferase family protein [Ruminococcus sp.]
MKSIGVLTLLYKNYNYGGVLQAYALTQYLRLNGYDAKGVLYGGSNNVVYPTNKDKLKQYSYAEVLKRGYRKVESKVKGRKINDLLSVRRNLFLDFEKEFIPTTSVYNDADLPRLDEEFDYFISGSDQVWNPNCAFLLFLQGFVKDNRKKISYAASISRNTLSSHEADIMIPYIKQFQSCSVREKTAQKILKTNGIDGVEAVLDPTFLLTKEQWHSIIPAETHSEKYALAYFFSDSKAYREKIQLFCKKHSIKLFYIPYAKQEYVSTDATGEGIAQEQVGPIEFLQLLRDAEYVFTDSFHGAALSINLEKEFVVFERDSQKSGASMNSRIYDLLEMFNLSNRLLRDASGIESTVSDRIDYSGVNSLLNQARVQSEAFLERALSTNTAGKGKIEDRTTYHLPQEYYAAYSCENALKCSSGGAFASLAKTVLQNSGVVYGAGFDSSFNVVYKRIDKIEDLPQILGSKYVRSAFTKQASFERIQEDLQNGKDVLFSGVGCQVGALKLFLQKKGQSAENLTTIEVACHGAPTARVWDSYKEYMEKKYGASIKSVNFRDKKYGWKAYSMCMQFENGRTYRKIMNADPYMQIFLSGYSVTDGCAGCLYKRNNRVSDISLGDLWGINICELSDVYKEGLSLVTVNTDKGTALLNRAKDEMKLVKLTAEQEITALSNLMGVCPDVSAEDKKSFISVLNQDGFKKAYKLWKKLNRKSYFIGKVKAIIKKCNARLQK